MGFSEDGDTLQLTFDDPKYAGLEVVCFTNVPASLYLHFAAAQEAADADRTKAALTLFGEEVLAEWNYERRGQPVPATGEGFTQASMPLILEIMGAWMQVMGGVPAPLEDASSSGGTSAEP